METAGKVGFNVTSYGRMTPVLSQSDGILNYQMVLFQFVLVSLDVLGDEVGGPGSCCRPIFGACHDCKRHLQGQGRWMTGEICQGLKEF